MSTQNRDLAMGVCNEIYKASGRAPKPRPVWPYVLIAVFYAGFAGSVIWTAIAQSMK